MSDKKLNHTKNCFDCFYCVRGICYVDKHDIIYKEQAYSCKYFKEYKKENEENENK